MSKRQDFTLHKVLRIYGNMFDHFEDFMKRLRAKEADFKQDLLRALEAATAKLKEYYAKVTPRVGTLLLMATMLDPYQKLSPFKKWDRAEGNDDTEPSSFKQQHRKLFLEYFETHYLPAIENHPPGPLASQQAHASNTPQNTTFNRKKLRRDDSDSENDNSERSVEPEQRRYDERHSLTGILANGTVLDGYPNGNVDRTFMNIDRQKYLLAAVEYIDSRRFSMDQARDEHFGTVAGDLDAQEEENDDPGKVTISWFEPGPDGYWRKIASMPAQGDIKYLQRVEQMARDIFSCVPHGVGVESSFSIARNVISWKQSRMTANTLKSNMIVRQHLLKKNTYTYRGDRHSDPNHDQNPKIVMKRLNKLLCFTDYQHFAACADAQATSRLPHEENPGIGFISGDEKEKDKKSWEAFEDDGTKYATLPVKAPKKRTNIHTTFASTDILRKINLRRPESDTEADDTEIDEDLAGQADAMHDFRYFTQEGGIDNPLEALELDDDEMAARDNACYVAPDADIRRLRRVAFEIPDKEQTPRRSTRRRRQSEPVRSDSEHDDPTPRPHPKTRRTIQTTLNAVTMPGAATLARAKTPAFAPKTKPKAAKPNTTKGKGKGKAKAKGKGRALPKRSETEGLGFLTGTESEGSIFSEEDEGLDEHQAPSLSNDDMESPCRQRPPSRASKRLRERSLAGDTEVQDQLAHEAST